MVRFRAAFPGARLHCCFSLVSQNPNSFIINRERGGSVRFQLGAYDGIERPIGLGCTAGDNAAFRAGPERALDSTFPLQQSLVLTKQSVEFVHDGLVSSLTWFADLMDLPW